MPTCVWTTSFFFVSSLKRIDVFGSWQSSGEGLQSHVVLSRSFFYSHCWPYPGSIFRWFSARMHSSRAPSLRTQRLSASILSRCANSVTRYLAFSSFVLILLHVKEISWILFNKFNNDVNSLKMHSSENRTSEYCRSQRRTR